MAGSERASANISSKYLKKLFCLVVRGKKLAFRSGITLCYLMRENVNDLTPVKASIIFEKNLMNLNKANAKCSLWEGRVFCNGMGWELNGCGAALLERALVPWQTQAEHEPAVCSGSKGGQRYAGLY